MIYGFTLFTAICYGSSLWVFPDIRIVVSKYLDPPPLLTTAEWSLVGSGFGYALACIFTPARFLASRAGQTDFLEGRAAPRSVVWFRVKSVTVSFFLAYVTGLVLRRAFDL